MIELSNSFGTVKLTDYGAHVLSYIPQGSDEVLWLSPYTKTGLGDPIRGGIPVCCPWFGPSRKDPSWPLHGFLRTRNWDIERRDESIIFLATEVKGDDNPYGYGSFLARCTVKLGRALEISLEIENRSHDPMKLEAGLHSYFLASPLDADMSDFSGLLCYDKTDGFKPGFGRKGFHFSADREIADFYMDTPSQSYIIDKARGRKIDISQAGFRSTVLWNPGRAAGLANQEIREQWDRFVCLESASCLDNKIEIEGNGRFQALVKIQTEAYHG
ncbi:MAG: hypothetical protein PHI83_07890 [Sphaerochaetaceae bacterium]|nr:hypothetical protein [Sphaerochaetaceae bacterium]